MAESETPNLGGRPMKFTDPDDVQREIDNYFALCDPHIEEKLVDNGRKTGAGKTIFEKVDVMTEQKPYLVSGLAVHLGTNRNTLFLYRKPSHYPADFDPEIRDRLIDSIEGAFAKIEEWMEAQLYLGNPNGAKFALSNNYKWVEKAVTDDKSKTQSELLDDLDDEDISGEAAKALNEKGIVEKTEAPGEEGSQTPE